MRSSLARVAGVALLGVGSFLFGVDGAPSSLVPARTAEIGVPCILDDVSCVPSSSGVDSAYQKRAKTYASVAVPNPFDTTHGYSQSKQMIPDRKFGDVYKITTTHHTGTLDLIAMNTKDKSITVKDANNADDTTPAATKVSLAGIMTGLWVNVGKQPATALSIVRFDTVVEKSTIAVITEVYKGLGLTKGDDVSFTVTSTDTDAKKKDAFTKLSDTTTFGVLVQKINGLYSTGKTIKSFTVSGTGPLLEVALQ